MYPSTELALPAAAALLKFKVIEYWVRRPTSRRLDSLACLDSLASLSLEAGTASAAAASTVGRVSVSLRPRVGTRIASYLAFSCCPNSADFGVLHVYDRFGTALTVLFTMPLCLLVGLAWPGEPAAAVCWARRGSNSFFLGEA